MTANQRLRELMEEYGLTQNEVVSLLNCEYYLVLTDNITEIIPPVSASLQYETRLQTVKSWLADPNSSYYREMPDIAIELLRLKLE